MINKINVRDDFRRDGLSASFLVDRDLYKTYAAAYPAGTRFNIGYPSICREEYNTCARILEIADDSNDIELCVVGHARDADLRLMAELLGDRPRVSANVWLPASAAAGKNILGQSTAGVLDLAENAIRCWKKVTSQPLDIALTDITCKEHGIDERVMRWYDRLKSLGYRSIILCDTKGIGDEDRLRNIFAGIQDFEWHPHNDNLKALVTSEIAAQYGVTHIGSSYLQFSERSNMLDPRELIQDRLNVSLLDKFYEDFRSLLGEDPLAIAHEIYNLGTALTGTHYKLWHGTETQKMYFGVTSDTTVFTLMTGMTISARELSFLKDEYLYRLKMKFITQEQLKAIAAGLSPVKLTHGQTHTPG